MSRFTVSPAARSDLRDIWVYSAETWSTDQADRYVTMIEDCFGRLASRDVSGRSASQYRHGYMRLAIGSHFIFYKSAADGAIELMRVLHQRMIHSSHLKD
jgi:toxin ParE1/3/4